MSELVDKETIQYTFNFINEIVPQMGANTQTMVEIFKTLMQIFRADEVE
jgi:hypothetical protein